MLRKLTRNPYTLGMSNIQPIAASSDFRAARGAFIRAALKSERYSIRAAAMAIGMSNTALSDRCRGLAPFLAEDIETLASLLKRNPVEFYGEYLAAGTKKAPTPVQGGGDVGPGRLELPTSTVEYGRFGHSEPVEQDVDAVVTSFEAHAAKRVS